MPIILWLIGRYTVFRVLVLGAWVMGGYYRRLEAS